MWKALDKSTNIDTRRFLSFRAESTLSNNAMLVNSVECFSRNAS